MFFSSVKSKLLQLYPNFIRTSPSNFVNSRVNPNKNPIIRKITTPWSSFVNRNFGRVVAPNGSMFARTFTTVKSVTLNESAWCPRKIGLQLKSIMTKFPKTSCVALAMCLFLRVERVPFSGRRHLVFRSPKHITIFRTPLVADIMLTNSLPFKNPKVLPSTHVKTLRFESIARKVGQGMHDVLGLKQDFNVMAYEPGQAGLHSKSNPVGSTLGRQTSYNTPKRWWSSNKGFVRGYSTRNLEGREWKVSVIDFPEIYGDHAFGHISICTGLLDKASDEEVAFVIGHEMGHAVGEHLMESLMWYLPKTIIIAMAIIISTIFRQHGYNYLRNDKIRCFVKNGRHRRHEYEADHIGMMLMASAGYDPQAALMLLSKYASSDYSPSTYTHPTGRERITYLKSPKRMNKAMKLYKEVGASKLGRVLPSADPKTLRFASIARKLGQGMHDY